MLSLDFNSIGSFLAVATGAGSVVAGSYKFVDWIRKRGMTPYTVEVKHIKDTGDADLIAALQLYEERFEGEEDQMDDTDDIVRWLNEAKGQTQRERLREDYFVAKRRGRVVGGLYTQYYKKSRLLFVSYLFVKKDEPKDTGGAISFHLAKYLRKFVDKEIKECGGVLFEVAPVVSEGQEPTKKSGRIRRFRAIARQIGSEARQVKIDYLQPKLSLNADKKEKQLALLYISLNGCQSSDSISRSEVENILKFIYEDLYGDSFIDNEDKNIQYRNYLNQLFQQVISKLPDNIPLS